MSRIIIVGSGVVGEATGRGFLRFGHRVEFTDIDPDRVEALRGKGFSASTTLDLSGPEAFVFVVVPTPHVGRKYDISYVESAAATIGQQLRSATSYHTVVVRSTVPPGTTEGIVGPILERESGRRIHEGFGLASNPEFLRALSSVEDFIMPRVTLIASRSARTRERLQDLYEPFGGEIHSFGNPAKAELVKAAHNLYNATKISFWNELWRVSRELGINSDEIAGVVATSSEASVNPRYGTRGGMPFGGECLPKDTNGFIGFATALGVDVPLAQAVIEVNEVMEGIVEEELASPFPVAPSSNGDSEPVGVVDIRDG